MKTIKKNRDSKDYLLTATTIEEVNEIRQKIKDYNKFVRKNNFDCPQKIVVTKGRRPKIKKEYYNFYTGKTSLVGYYPSGDIVGGLQNATEIDVYLRNK